MKSLIPLLFGLFLINQSATEQTEVIPYPDNSLYVAQYQALGMPSPDELWNAAEYKRAVKVITGYYNIDKWSIPRKDSEYSGALFERMITLENFDIILDKSEMLQERLREHDELLKAVNRFLAMYVEPNESEQRFSIEALSLLSLSANTTKYSIGVLKDLQDVMSNRGIRNSDLDLMHDKLIKGVAASIEENLSIIENDYHQYRRQDIEWFTEVTSEWIVDMKQYVSDEQVIKIEGILTKMIETHSNKKIQSRLKELKKDF